eukprot:1089440_1
MAPYILGKLWILVVITRIGRPNDGFFDSVGAFEWSQRRVMRRHERNIGGTMSLWSMNWQCKDMFRDYGLPFAAEYGDEEQEEGGGGMCHEDIGQFWQQIVEVYMLGGHILLGNAQYCDAKDTYSQKLGPKHCG